MSSCRTSKDNDRHSDIRTFSLVIVKAVCIILMQRLGQGSHFEKKSLVLVGVALVLVSPWVCGGGLVSGVRESPQESCSASVHGVSKNDVPASFHGGTSGPIRSYVFLPTLMCGWVFSSTFRLILPDDGQCFISSLLAYFANILCPPGCNYNDSVMRNKAWHRSRHRLLQF